MPSVCKTMMNNSGTKLNRLLYLSGCGYTWPPNTTPIQRAIYLSNRFSVDFISDSELPNPQINTEENNRYFYIKSISSEIIIKMVMQDCPHIKYTHVWTGPSWKTVNIGRKIADHFNAKLVVDMYDHERLSAGVAWRKRRYIKALYYELMALRLRYLLRKSDIFIHAIGNSIGHYHLPNDVRVVSCLNGVSEKLFSKDIQSISTNSRFSLCYVGESSEERTPQLSEIINLSGQYGLDYDLHLIGFCNKGYLEKLTKLAKKSSINIIFHGFMPWVDAMQIVARCHICLHLFPDRQELSCVFPLKIAEYLYLGKPVLATDSPGPEKMLGENLKECLVSDGDSTGWINLISRIKNDANYADRLSRDARERSRHLEWDVIHSPLDKVLGYGS